MKWESLPASSDLVRGCVLFRCDDGGPDEDVNLLAVPRLAGTGVELHIRVGTYPVVSTRPCGSKS